jgi:hypothetical protein
MEANRTERNIAQGLTRIEEENIVKCDGSEGIIENMVCAMSV